MFVWGHHRVAVAAMVVVVMAVGRQVRGVPNYQGCLSAEAKALPYCDVRLSHDARLDDLMGRLSLDDAVALVSPDPAYGSCPIMTKNLSAAGGIPRTMWLVEVNTGAASACLGENRCATTFSGPGGLGASFNRTLWYLKGDVVSTDMRAMSNADWYRGIDDNLQPLGAYKIGLTGYGPNINLVRDPRFGRNSELPGEDPFLTGQYAIAYTRGLQQVDSQGYQKLITYLKHFDAYSVEQDRMHSNFKISLFTFFDSFLPAFRDAFLQSGTSGAMCSYNAENGRPSCANGWLLDHLVRNVWGRADALITSDCGAISNMRGAPLFAPTDEAAAAWSINNGTDIEAGSTIWTYSMATAVQKGLVTRGRVFDSTRRAMAQQMRAGRFDPVELVSWTSVPKSAVNSTRHQEIQQDAAAQSFVLLKNEKRVLPLKTNTKVAVVGPQAVAQFGLLSDYYGDFVCYKEGQTPQKKYWGCIPTIGDSIARINGQGSTTVVEGCDIASNRTSGFAAGIAAAKAADHVVLVLGINHNIEHEGIDRSSIALPGVQAEFARAIYATGKPTTLILVNGGAVAIDGLIEPASAIIEAFYPAFGAPALAQSLFGMRNQWGKLPITIYPADYVNQIKMDAMDFASAPGRGYRYYQNTPLFKFGEGLSLTSFDMTCREAHDHDPEHVKFHCQIENTGDLRGDEVIMAYHSVSPPLRSKIERLHPVPLKQLIGFERLTAEAGDKSGIEFVLKRQDAFSLTTATGERKIYPGEHTITFSRGHGPEISFHFDV